MSVTVVNADNDNMGSVQRRPDHRRQLDRATTCGPWRSPPGTPRAGPTEVMVDADTADKHHLKLGDETAHDRRHRRPHARRSSGIATFKVTNPGAAIVYFDTETAQRELLGATGRFTHVNVTAAAGVSDAQLKQNVAAEPWTAPTRCRRPRRPPTRTARTSSGFMDVMKYAMLGFAGIAFLVGIFLIINTFSMLVAQRTREIGLMRAIGSSRKQVNRSVLVEALLLGRRRLGPRRRARASASPSA